MFNFYKVFCDSAVLWQYGLQDPATPIAEGIIRFHHDLIFILVFVVCFVSWILFRTLYHFSYKPNQEASIVVHGTVIEIVWTLIPAVLLMIIAVPSFALLYSVDEVVDPSITLKVIGHQWYWSYEYSDYVANNLDQSIVFDSYMLPDDELSSGDFRLLEVDNRVVLPINTHVRVVVTSADVLHSWAIPSFGVKIDACPGRLNEASLFIQRPGVFYGQCSEICGINHGFIPIAVEAIRLQDYILWVSSKLEEVLLSFNMNLSFFQIFFLFLLGLFLFKFDLKGIQKIIKIVKVFKQEFEKKSKAF